MELKTVLVTGIGGNVGQGILRNIRNLPYNIRLIGTNVVELTGGNHLCDAFYPLPYAFQDTYIKEINKVIIKEKVDLILPATDLEGYYLAASEHALYCKVVVSALPTINVYLDKLKTFQHHLLNDLPFAKTFLPSEYKDEFVKAIAKPRKGRGSRGLLINPRKWDHLSDEEYIIQEMHEGKEITIAFYVAEGQRLHGFIAMERKLENGATSECHVFLEYQSEIEELLQNLIKANGFKGCINVQTILDAKGEFHVFEINCRISGTNSLRHNFGFQDIKYTLQEYLFNEPLDEPNVKPGSAVRILMDVIYTEKNSEYTSNSKYYIY